MNMVLQMGSILLFKNNNNPMKKLLLIALLIVGCDSPAEPKGKDGN